MVGISDLRADPVNFRDREGGGDMTVSGDGTFNHALYNHLYFLISTFHNVVIAGVPKKRQVVGATEKQLYGSSWEATHNQH